MRLACFLPPHVLRSIAENGSPEQRALARRSLSIDRGLRARRAGALPERRSPDEGVAARGTKRRAICDAEHEQSLPGAVVRLEGANATQDVAVDEAYDRPRRDLSTSSGAPAPGNSIDDEGLPLRATVHYGEGYDNAFWNGERMVFGDGDGDLFNRFTGVRSTSSGTSSRTASPSTRPPQYAQQPGALNESVSDVFGSLLKQWTLEARRPTRPTG